jgi:protein O-mannosyl-transferase
MGWRQCWQNKNRGQMTEHGRQNKILLLISAGLVAATVIAYEPVRHNEFVSYDDTLYITENPGVTGGITGQSVIRAFIRSHAGNWHPVTWLSHMLDCQFFGLNPVGHHFVNVLLHITNALLLFWILNSITASIWPSAFVAAVFALHPLQVESVAWAAERKTVLSGFFWFLTIAVYIWYVKQPGIRRYILLFGVYGLCIMTKPVVVTLPFILVLLDFWPLNRIRIKNEELKENTLNSRFSIFNSLYEKIPLLALSALLSLMTFIAQRIGGMIRTFDTLPLDIRIANAFVAYIRYIGKIICPIGLAVFYPHPRVNFSNVTVIICFLLCILITAISIYAGRRKKYLAVGWLWFVGTLVPMIGLVQVGKQAMADRYMYVSILGLLIIITFAIKDVIGGRPRLKIMATALAVIVLTVLLIITRMQVRRWQNDMTLFGYALKVTRNNEVAETDYGQALAKEGRLSEAELHFRKAVRIEPTSDLALWNLGYSLFEQGKAGEAADCFSKLLRQGNTTWKVNLGLSASLIMQNKCREAARYFTEALKVSPKRSDISKRLVTALTTMGKLNDAITCLNESLQANSGQVQIYETLGEIYTQVEDYKPAIQNLTNAANLDPNDANVLNSLSWLLATTGEVTAENANKAVEFSRRACELTGYKDVVMLDTLAAAYAAARNFEEAVKIANQAVETAETCGQQVLANEIRDRAKLYKAGLRYRQK